MDGSRESLLRRRLAELNEEVRRYPTPIARCDAQLAALLEERTEIQGLLAAPEQPSGGCSPANTWINDGGMNGA